MAKEVQCNNEPSQSSSSLPPLAENEVELVIDRFWRDTRPRVCVRSETKMVNGFNFRLLVWPQGSKQSQSHLSAFVEVVPPTSSASSSSTSAKSTDGQRASASTREYPPDWACPCVFYRISVMNFKQKYPYSKADTWTFSYVCPDRGWHTLLDTRYINRRDGYLSNEGSLVIRAIAFPRFGHPLSVLPLLANISHSDEESSSPAHHFGLGNFLASDHLNCLIQTLYHLPGFRKALYSLGSPGPSARPPTTLDEVELETIEQGLISCNETVKEIMNRVTNAAPEISRMIQAEFLADCLAANLCTCHSTPASTGGRHQHLTHMYGRCRILILCLEEFLFSVSQSLLGRRRSSAPAEVMSKRVQFDAYRQIVKDCKRILTTVAHSLFLQDNDEHTPPTSNGGKNVVEELQHVFAKLEYGESTKSVSGGGAAARVIDTRNLLSAIGMACAGLQCSASPDGMYVVFLYELKKSANEMTPNGWETSGLMDIVMGAFAPSSADADDGSFSHIRLSSAKPTSIEKHLTLWCEQQSAAATSTPTSSSEPPLPVEPVLGGHFSKLPKILTLQFLQKVKDRLDVTERISLEQFVLPTEQPVNTTAEVGPDVVEKEGIEWDSFLSHQCNVGGNNGCLLAAKPAPLTNSLSTSYRLHSVTFASGSEAQSSHYSVVVRHNRIGGWTRFDDAFTEELTDIAGGASGGTVSTASCPDWVFSPEWSCSALSFIREDAIDQLYQRGVDVRLLRPDLFSAAVREMTSLSGLSLSDTKLLCNRQLPLTMLPTSTPSTLDASCQVEVCLLTEKDVLSSAPGGFFVPFSFHVPNVGRKLIVRKDIQIERLMQAVTEHFKIPLGMQRLLALRYYPETGQERFELMQPHRSVLGYLALDSAAVAGGDKSSSGGQNRSAGRSGSGGSSPCNGGSQLYVLVTLSPKPTELITVWIKLLDESTMAVVSVCLLSVDPKIALREYFDTVASKSGGAVSVGTQFIVYEEVGVRQLELRRTSSAIGAERIIDGDILIFVPLTESAKRTLIVGGGVGGKQRAKRRVLSAVALAPSLLTSHHSKLELSSDSSSDDDDDDDLTPLSGHDELHTPHNGGDLNERCREFLSRAAGDSELIDEAYEELILSEMAAHVLSPDGGVVGDEARLETIRRYLRYPAEASAGEPGTSSSRRLADLMTDFMREFDHPRKSLTVPLELKEELGKVPGLAMCYYCQLPISASGGAKVSCSVGCLKPASAVSTHVYHERCVQELVAETGTNTCIVTEGCRGKIVVDPKSIIANLVTREVVVPKMSLAVIRAKLGHVLPLPATVDTGSQVWGRKGAPPALPSGVRKGGKQKSLPTEALWWNACLLAFGGKDQLGAVVGGAKKCDQARLDEAGDIYRHWCRTLQGRHNGVQQKSRNLPVTTKASVVVPVNEGVPVHEDDSSAESSVSSSDDSSSDSEESTEDDVLVVEKSLKALSLEPNVMSEIGISDMFFSDDESNPDHSDTEDFILVSGRSGNRSVSTKSNPETPTAAVVIPQGFLGEKPTPMTKEQEEEKAETAAANIANQTVSSILLSELISETDPGSPNLYSVPVSITTPELEDSCAGAVLTNPLVESRMTLLPGIAKEYCLPIELVFVYYSEQFFATLPPSAAQAGVNTVSLIPAQENDAEGAEKVIDAISLAAFNTSVVISRLFSSPHQTFPDSPVVVQWFVEFETQNDAHRFLTYMGEARPDWGPEAGALLPASLLGFAV